MRFIETPLSGAWLVEPEPLCDERGWFARSFDVEEFRARGMDPTVAQCNISHNARAGTLRGMHYQADSHWEPKLVRCTRGAVYDVIIDLRRDSPSYARWHGVKLSAEDARMLFVPVGFAQGFQTLLDESEVSYQMGHHYVPAAARGVRWDDPAFGIAWPQAPDGRRTISERDRSYPDYVP